MDKSFEEVINKQIIHNDDLCNRLWGIGFNQEDRLRVNLIKSLIEADPVLDLGCSDGTISIEIARMGHFVCGLNMNRVELDKGRRLLLSEQIPIRKNIVFVEGLIEKATAIFDRMEFSTMLLCEVLEHTHSPEFILSQISKIKGNPKLIVSVPNRDVSIGTPRWCLPDIHIHEFSVEKFNSMLEVYLTDIKFHSMYNNISTISIQPFLIATGRFKCK